VAVPTWLVVGRTGARPVKGRVAENPERGVAWWRASGRVNLNWLVRRWEGRAGWQANADRGVRNVGGRPVIRDDLAERRRIRNERGRRIGLTLVIGSRLDGVAVRSNTYIIRDLDAELGLSVNRRIVRPLRN